MFRTPKPERFADRLAREVDEAAARERHEPRCWNSHSRTSSGQDFEKLCERLAELEGEPEHVSRFGDPGQDQEGIDIYTRLAGGGYVAYQCKRYQRLYPAIIRNAVSEFLDNAWSKKAARFVVCTSNQWSRHR